MKNKYLIVAVTSVILLTIVVAMWIISGNSLGDGVERSKTITFVVDGREAATIDRDFFGAMDSRTFPAVIRSNGKKPQQTRYTGVALDSLFQRLDLDLTGKSQVVVKAIDGYVTVLTMDELQQGRVYLAYQMDGEDLKPINEGGAGPFQLVIPSDPFSQRWCKYVYQVEVK